MIKATESKLINYHSACLQIVQAVLIKVTLIAINTPNMFSL